MEKNSEKQSKIRKKINKYYEENELANLESNKNRARSFTVGTAFGGIIEISMRGDHHSMWCILQPVEAVEFIEQLAAASGLQVALRPKQDFASWRGWNVETDNRYWVGSAHWQLGNDDPAQKALEGQKEETKQLPEPKEEKKVSTKKKKKKEEVLEENYDEEQ